MDNVLNKIICLLSCTILIIGIIISSFFLNPIFAISSDDYQLQYRSSIYSSSSTFRDGFSFLKLNNNNYCNVGVYVDNLPNVYYFVYISSSNIIHGVTLVATDDLSSFPAGDFVNFNFNSTGYYVRKSYLNNTYSDYSYCDKSLDGVYSSDVNEYLCPHFNSLEDGLLAFSNFLNPSYDSLYDGLNIPRGYFARIEFRDNSSVDSKSISLSTNWPDYRQVEQINQSQQYKYDGGSSAESILSYGGFSAINYSGTGNADIFGGHRSGIAYFNGNYSKYLYIINPVYTPYNFINTLNMNFNGGGAQAYNSNITLHDPDGIVESVRIYAITESIGSGLKADYDVDDNTGANAIVTNGGLAWEDDNGQLYNPPLNGNTGVSNEDASNNFIDIIENAFNNLVEKIQHILTPAIGYFNTLLNSFNDFVHWLSNLWSWLPDPIVTLIEAVLYVSISVGLIKLVLK